MGAGQGQSRGLRAGAAAAALAFAALAVPAGTSAAAGAARPADPDQGPTDAPATDSPVVATGKDLVLTRAELLPVLLQRYALSERGRELLRLELQSRVLLRLAEERGVEISDREVERRWKSLDEAVRASGDPRGLAGQIADQGLGADEFRDYLRVSMMHERLTRLALDLPPEAQVTGAQQEIWLDQEMGERGLETHAPPWTDGVIARCGDVELRAEELGLTLLRRLDPAEIRETCWHLLLAKGIERRMPDVSPEARARAADAEVERRRRRAERENPAVRFEQVLAAQGRNLEVMRNDPSVTIAALSRLWVDRTAGPDGLRATYERERAFFEGRFGKAAETHMLFLVAARYRNQLNPRTYEDAEAELARLLETVGDTADFAALATRASEEPNTRANGGDLGWVTRLDPRWPAPLREAVFAELDAGKALPATGSAVGPVRLDAGSAVLWVSAVRESPPWEQMAEHVHEELRRRFLLDVLPDTEVRMAE